MNSVVYNEYFADEDLMATAAQFTNEDLSPSDNAAAMSVKLSAASKACQQIVNQLLISMSAASKATSYIHTCTHVNIYVRVCVCIYICMYINKCIVHMNIYLRRGYIMQAASVN